MEICEREWEREHVTKGNDELSFRGENWRVHTKYWHHHNNSLSTWLPSQPISGEPRVCRGPHANFYSLLVNFHILEHISISFFFFLAWILQVFMRILAMALRGCWVSTWLPSFWHLPGQKKPEEDEISHTQVVREKQIKWQGIQFFLGPKWWSSALTRVQKKCSICVSLLHFIINLFRHWAWKQIKKNVTIVIMLHQVQR